jgi:hypothetical protein
MKEATERRLLCCVGEWEKKEPVEICYADPGVAWEERYGILPHAI